MVFWFDGFINLKQETVISHYGKIYEWFDGEGNHSSTEATDIEIVKQIIKLAKHDFNNLKEMMDVLTDQSSDAKAVIEELEKIKNEGNENEELNDGKYLLEIF